MTEASAEVTHTSGNKFSVLFAFFKAEFMWSQKWEAIILFAKGGRVYLTTWLTTPQGTNVTSQAVHWVSAVNTRTPSYLSTASYVGVYTRGPVPGVLNLFATAGRN